MPEFKKYLPELEAGISDALSHALGRYLEEASADIQALGAELAEKLVTYAADNNQRGLDITVARLHLLGEKHRIHSTRQTWALMAEVSKSFFRFLVKVMV